MNSDLIPVAIVTGGSAGLGFVIASTLVENGYHVAIVGRNSKRLESAAEKLNSLSQNHVIWHSADLVNVDEVSMMMSVVLNRFGRLDALVNAVGLSDRGLIENLTSDRLGELLSQNVLTSLLCTQAALLTLEASHGSVVNIGSLASKVGARYVGGYGVAKHALAGMTAQMRLELRSRGIHVGLVCPGPIRRDDAGERYRDQVDDRLPDQALKPGAGTRIKGLAPERVAQAVVRCIEKRQPDVILPGYLRVLIAVGHAFPRLGDWLLLKFTSSKKA